MSRIDTTNKPLNWRTPETHARYMHDIDEGGLDEGCRLCERAAIQTFTHWKIIDNKYPYDRVAEIHEMLVTLRHTSGDDLREDEVQELTELKQTVLNERYRFIVEGLPNAKSIPGHFHLHLIVPNQA